jgi:hypothetical protein
MSFEKLLSGTRVILALSLLLATTAGIAESAAAQGSEQRFTVDDLVRL